MKIVVVGGKIKIPQSAVSNFNQFKRENLGNRTSLSMVKDFREETMKSGISNLMMESGGSRL